MDAPHVLGCIRTDSDLARRPPWVWSIHFQCRDDYGAVLLLHPLGVSHAIKSHKLISRYMRQHFERWLEFANSRFELGLTEDHQDKPLGCHGFPWRLP